MSGHAVSNEAIDADAFRWIIGAGAFALLLTAFLIAADYGLSHSDREKRLGETLRELRTAQASMASHVTDQRQTQSYLYGPAKKGN